MPQGAPQHKPRHGPGSAGWSIFLYELLSAMLLHLAEVVVLTHRALEAWAANGTLLTFITLDTDSDVNRRLGCAGLGWASGGRTGKHVPCF